MRTWSILILLVCLSSFSGCWHAPKVVVLPDSHQLIPAIKCPDGATCALDPGKITLDRGYLREVMGQLEACGQP